MLEQGVGLSLVRASGELRGRLTPATGYNLALRQAQYRAAEDTVFSTRSAGRRRQTGEQPNDDAAAAAAPEGLPDELLPRLEAALQKVEQATSIETLRGLEGSAARAYFGLLRQSMRVDLAFEKRARRPPPDPVNSLLSLGYTLLNEALMTALELVGLDPYAGFLHADKYGPALALDLVEEFRAPIVDSLVLTLINKRMLGPGDFVMRRQARPKPGRRAGRVGHGRGLPAGAASESRRRQSAKRQAPSQPRAAGPNHRITHPLLPST